MLGIIILWALLSVVVGVYADKKGRSGIGFGFLSIITSPLIGFIIAWLVSSDNAAIEQSAITKGEVRKCPACAELVKVEAKICKHCRSELTEQSEEEAKSEVKPVIEKVWKDGRFQFIPVEQSTED